MRLKRISLILCLLLAPVLSSCTQNDIDIVIDAIIERSTQKDDVKHTKAEKIYYSDEEIIDRLLKIAGDGALKDFSVTYDPENTGICLGSYKGKEKEIELPDSLEGIEITKIAKECFKDCDFLERIKLPNGLVVIGEEAFANCSKLEYIVMDNDVRTMGGYAFKNCTSLLNVTISGMIQAISRGSFQNCAELRLVILNDGIKIIAGEAFSGCTKLREVRFTDSLNAIARGAFWGCESMEYISKVNIQQINQEAFEQDE